MNKLIQIALVFFLCMNTGQAQDLFNNGLAIEVGYGGGDGIFPTYLYGLKYTRDVSKRISGYAKYNVSKGATPYTGVGDDKYILEENTTEFPNTRFGQFVFIGVGLDFKIVKTDNSYLYLISGLRYGKSKRSRTGGYVNDDGDQITSAVNFMKNGFGYELGLGYNKIFLNKYFAGLSFNFTNFESRIAVSLLVGTKF